MSDTATATRTGTCLGLPAYLDMATDQKCAAKLCDVSLEQNHLEGTVDVWLPARCANCERMVTVRIVERETYFDDARRRQAVANNLAAANVRTDISTGRLTLERLPELYEEIRVQGGVPVHRYQEIVRIVTDFISVPPLLRTSGIASILLLHGAKGVGKTWLLEAAIGHVAREQQRSAVFTSPIQMWADIKAGYDDDREKSEALILRELSGVALLGIDDLARKTSPTEWEVGILLQVIDERYRTNRPTIISSNYSPRGLYEMWSDAEKARMSENIKLLCDRLSDTRAVISISMSGTSLRRETGRQS